jgi:hypothetical protein
VKPKDYDTSIFFYRIYNFIKSESYKKNSIITNIDDYINMFNKPIISIITLLEFGKLILPNNAHICGIIYNENQPYADYTAVYNKLKKKNEDRDPKIQQLLIYNDNSKKYFKFTPKIDNTAGNGFLRQFRSDILPQNERAKNEGVYVLGVPLDEEHPDMFRISILIIRSFIYKFNITNVYFYSDLNFNIGTETFDKGGIDTTKTKKIFKEELIDLFTQKYLDVSPQDYEKFKPATINSEEIINVNGSTIKLIKNTFLIN